MPEPNVRVQAVMDGQGVAINDALAGAELDTGTLRRVSPVELDDSGHLLAYGPDALDDPNVAAFRD